MVGAGSHCHPIGKKSKINRLFTRVSLYLFGCQVLFEFASKSDWLVRLLLDFLKVRLCGVQSGGK